MQQHVLFNSEKIANISNVAEIPLHDLIPTRNGLQDIMKHTSQHLASPLECFFPQHLRAISELSIYMCTRTPAITTSSSFSIFKLHSSFEENVFIENFFSFRVYVSSGRIYWSANNALVYEPHRKERAPSRKVKLCHNSAGSVLQQLRRCELVFFALFTIKKRNEELKDTNLQLQLSEFN